MKWKKGIRSASPAQFRISSIAMAGFWSIKGATKPLNERAGSALVCGEMEAIANPVTSYLLGCYDGTKADTLSRYFMGKLYYFYSEKDISAEDALQKQAAWEAKYPVRSIKIDCDSIKVD